MNDDLQPAAAPRLRLLLVDDHRVVTEGLSLLLAPRFDVIGCLESGRALLDHAVALNPDVVVIDVSMPLLNGIDATRQLRRLVPSCKIVFLSMHSDTSYVAEAFRAGAHAYVLKRGPASEVVHAVKEAAAGRHYVSPLIAPDSADWVSSNEGDFLVTEHTLTTRQREVLQLVAEGKSMKEIAVSLNISVKTVEFHKTRIIHQLGLRTTAELTKYAVAHGLTAVR